MATTDNSIRFAGTSARLLTSRPRYGRARGRTLCHLPPGHCPASRQIRLRASVLRRDGHNHERAQRWPRLWRQIDGHMQQVWQVDDSRSLLASEQAGEQDRRMGCIGRRAPLIAPRVQNTKLASLSSQSILVEQTDTRLAKKLDTGRASTHIAAAAATMAPLESGSLSRCCARA